MSAISILPRFAISQLTDAHIEPTPFTAVGEFSEVIESTLQAIKLEECHDIRATGAQTKIGPGNGSLTFDDGSKTRLGYTHGAYEQLCEKIHGLKIRGAHHGRVTSPSKFADVALWASGKVRSDMHAEMVKFGRRAHITQTFRIAKDAHNNDPKRQGVEYVRAVVSERHSTSNGDDTAFFAALNEFLGGNPAFLEFYQGAAYVKRDPAGETVGRVDSKKKLSGDARLTLGFQNNEIGEGAARVGLSLTFELPAIVDRYSFRTDKVEPTRIEISVPGKRGNARSIHLGTGPSHMFNAFAESLAMALVWAPTAVAKMRALATPEQIEEARALLCKGFEGRDLRTRQTELGTFLERLDSDGLAPQNSALSIILMLTHFGQSTAAQKLVTNFAGTI